MNNNTKFEFINISIHDVLINFLPLNLSLQEYKRQHGQPDPYYNMSSGSLHSSSVSLSSSTDCLEEFQGDAPFSGKESTSVNYFFDIKKISSLV